MPRTTHSPSISPSYRQPRRSAPNSAHQVRLNQPTRPSQSSYPPVPYSLPPTKHTSPTQNSDPRSRPTRSKSRSFDSLLHTTLLPEPAAPNPFRLTPPSRRPSRSRPASKRPKHPELHARSLSPETHHVRPHSPPPIPHSVRGTPVHPIKKLKVAPSPTPAASASRAPSRAFRLDRGDFPPLLRPHAASRSPESSQSQSAGDVWPADRSRNNQNRNFRLETEHFPPLGHHAQEDTNGQRKRTRQQVDDMEEEAGEANCSEESQNGEERARKEEGECAAAGIGQGAGGVEGRDMTDEDAGSQNSGKAGGSDDGVDIEDNIESPGPECDSSGNGCAEGSDATDSDSWSSNVEESGFAADATGGHASVYDDSSIPNASRDSAGCSAERAAPLVQELFIPSGEAYKKANDMLHGLEMRQEMRQEDMRWGQWGQPVVVAEEEEEEEEEEFEVVPPGSEGFRKLMIEITEEQGVDLSMHDFELFDELQGISSFRYGDCYSQFETSGICVEVPLGAPLPEETKDAWKFKYGPEERTVMVHPKALSPLGLSVLSWILMPGPYTVAPFISVMKAVPFKNCLVEHVVGSMGLWSSLKRSLWSFALRTVTEYVSDPKTVALLCQYLLGRKAGREYLIEAQENKYMVVPRSWLYWLNVKHKFVKEHGSYGDMALRIGHNPSKDSKSIGFFSVISRVSTSARSLVDFFSASDSGSKYGEILGTQANFPSNSRDTCHEGFDDGGKPLKKGTEYLQLDRENRLVYTKVGKEWKATNLSVGQNLSVDEFNFKFNRQFVPRHIEPQNYRNGSNSISFGSLSLYVGFQMKGSSQRSLLRRMKWLEEALNKKAIFPKGSNQIFLRFTTGYASTNRKVEIFEEDDCRITRDDLNKAHRVVQKHTKDPGKLYFMDDGNGTEVFASKCYARGSEMWEIEPPCLEVLQGGTTFVSRDLG